ncbi:MAG TPA: cellulase family glycosylhydrolase [Anaerolineae bacterium]|nr:cellulase family glycosylhydrolase [Anaerolineae bacterium]
MRFHRLVILLVSLPFLVLTACAPQVTVTLTATSSAPGELIGAAPVVITPTSQTKQPVTCADLDASWAANDWAPVIEVLQHLQDTRQECGTEPLSAKLYAAYFNYATALESTGKLAEAITQYQAALSISPRGRGALTALARLKALPTLPPPPCHPNDLAPYRAKLGDFVTINQHGFALKNRPFYLRGFNYYPRHAPWEAFLTDANLTEVAQELDLIAKAGFNTLRIALWYDPLFTCAPEDATPNASGFAKLDAFIKLVRERDLKLIVTLNDLPDFYYRPVYTDYARYDAQTAFIINRYRGESAILAWDLRNEPDLDFGADGRPPVASPEAVTKWLTHVAEIVRQHDQHHLVTIGWWGDATTANESVDFLSFHHWTDAPQLAQRIKALLSASNKPIVLEEVGYPAWNQDSETRQAQLLQEVLSTAEKSSLAGWLIWTAFDFVPPPGQAPSAEYSFGLWRADLTPKPALSVLPVSALP